MSNVLILGHKGMLGNAVLQYLESTKKFKINSVSVRYGEEGFEQAVKDCNPDFIVNCIGIIPQKKPTVDDYRRINIELPTFLETLGVRTVHPSTDCEFSGTIPPTKKYSKEDARDAEDEYGKSKADISKKIEEGFKNTKIIRTSIIGHETATSVALLDWFLNASGNVNGFTNHYWNGVTTLQWAKLCEELLEDWESFPILNQYGTEKVESKYDLLCAVKEVYGKNVTIDPFKAPQTVNKCLESDKPLPTITEQLVDLKDFYRK